jgi:hypothetical protein
MVISPGGSSATAGSGHKRSHQRRQQAPGEHTELGCGKQLRILERKLGDEQRHGEADAGNGSQDHEVTQREPGRQARDAEAHLCLRLSAFLAVVLTLLAQTLARRVFVEIRAT